MNQTINQGELLTFLQARGAKSNAAIKYLFKHRLIRKQFSQSISPYAATLKNYFPINQTIATTEGAKSYQIHNALNFFLSEAILKLVEKVEEGTFQAVEFEVMKAFILTTGNRMCRDWLRKNRLKNERERPHEEIDLVSTEVERSPDETLIKAERHSTLRKVLDQLGKHCKKILLMKYDDYSDAEIVETTGLKNRNAVKSTRKRCMDRLEALIRVQPELLR